VAVLLAGIFAPLALLLAWPPRRRIHFDATGRRVRVSHHGLLRQRKDRTFRAEEILGVEIEDQPDRPGRKPRLILRTRDGDVYLIDVGAIWIDQELDPALQQMMSGWGDARV
jgi:hypothetical protein